MYKIWISGLMMIWSVIASAQYGIRLGHDFASQDLWTNRNKPITDLVSTNIQDFHLAIDYRNCLRKARIEFYPGLRYERSVSTNALSKIGESFNIKYQSLFIGSHVHAYILDMKGDCNGTTPMGYGDWFKKGFFIRTGGEIGLRAVEVFTTDKRRFNSVTDYIFDISFATGLDIRISEICTLTPILYGSYELFVESPTNTGRGVHTWAYGGEIRLGIELIR